MRSTYRVLAQAIAVLVVVQAALMVWAIAGLFSWIDAGNPLDAEVIKSWEETPPTFAGATGHFIHVMSGTFLIPLLGLILLIVAFFAKVPRGVMFATVVFVSIVVQYLAGAFAEPDMPYLGLVHGANAFILFMAALMAAKTAKESAVQGTPASVG